MENRAMNFQDHYQSELARYVEIAAIPGWKRYAWEKVNEMAAEWPTIYASLPDDLTTAMKAKQ